MNRKTRVTIIDVAQAAGVSKQTVSRVLNERPDVSPETRQHVQAIIDQLGYRPSAVARSLIQQRSYTLGVVTAGLKYIGPSQTLNGIADKAAQQGYAVLLTELPSFDAADTRPTVEALLTRQVDGILWAVQEVGENRAWLEDQSASLPVPVLFLTMAQRPDLSIVSVDNFAGARMATEHLISAGCRSIGHISGPLDWWESRQRKEGWATALRQAGREIDDSHWTEGNWSSRSGAAAFETLLAQYPLIDGVFAANDQMALSVLRIAHQKGRRVPQDLAVIGFDGMAESAYFWPSLSTINQNQHELGCIAVEKIVQMIAAHQNQASIPPEYTRLQPELIIRESTTKPG